MPAEQTATEIAIYEAHSKKLIDAGYSFDVVRTVDKLATDLANTKRADGCYAQWLPRLSTLLLKHAW